MSTAPAGWANPASVADKLWPRWHRGDLLVAHAGGQPFPRVEVPLRGPSARQIATDLAAARQWRDQLESGSRQGACYDLVWKTVGERDYGRNTIPHRALVSRYDQAWSLLGVGEQVRRFDRIRQLVEATPAVHDWVVAHPIKALDPALDWGKLLAAHDWLDLHRGSGRYLREISAPGVDTKFAESNLPVLAALLGVSRQPTEFLRGLGLRNRPELVRLRFAPELGVPQPLSEIMLRAEELGQLAITPRSALVVENEVTYLSVPVPPGGVVIWGKGFEVDRVGRLPWLGGVAVDYWGDIDTHGFAILDRLRAWLPQARSVLMDRDTLTAHRPRWVREERPTRAALARLDPAEDALYHDLVTDALGENVRLEQELVDWQWALGRLSGPGAVHGG